MKPSDPSTFPAQSVIAYFNGDGAFKTPTNYQAVTFASAKHAVSGSYADATQKSYAHQND
jgi:hypothetical protein